MGDRQFDLFCELCDQASHGLQRSAGSRPYAESVNYPAALTIACKRIAELEAERRWIPVTEALPEEDYFDGDNMGSRRVLVRYIEHPRKPIVGVEFGHFLNGRAMDDRMNPIRRATHWMPLPEPPEDADAN